MNNGETRGWARRFTIEAERTDEYVELYELMGHEVRVETVTPDLASEGGASTAFTYILYEEQKR